MLGKAPLVGEAVVVAELELASADDKRRPDGTDLFAVRRPLLYRPLAEAPVTPAVERRLGAEQVDAGAYQPLSDGPDALDEALEAIRWARLPLTVLPELFCLQGARIHDVARAQRGSTEVLRALAEACTGEQLVATSLVRDGRLEAVLVGRQGLVHAQPQLHRSDRHPWSRPGNRLALVDLPWARLALLVGDDALQPETLRLCALAGAEVVALPAHVQEPWELALGLVERSAENRVCLVAASRGGTLLTTLQEDFTIMTPWKTRPFDGLLTLPLTVHGGLGLTRATLHPRRAANKVVSHRTHLVDGRPWQLIDAITREDRTHA